MGLKCSVFGHRFGDAEVTRQQQEQGDEAVTTITETETCERCQETRVVSDYTEVATLETHSETVNNSNTDADTDDIADAPSQDRPGTSGHNRVIDEGKNQGESPSSPADNNVEADNRQVATPDLPGDDDAVILTEASDADDEAASQGRAPGEWPDQGQEADADADEEWIPDLTTVAETGMDGLPAVENHQSAGEQLNTPATVPEGEFHCPECGFTTTVESTSLREGDFCPECHRGTIEHSLEE